jgi:hypothetical protein
LVDRVEQAFVHVHGQRLAAAGEDDLERAIRFMRGGTSGKPLDNEPFLPAGATTGLLQAGEQVFRAAGVHVRILLGE